MKPSTMNEIIKAVNQAREKHPHFAATAWLGKVILHCPYESGVRVVGNTHENPEILEGGK